MGDFMTDIMGQVRPAVPSKLDVSSHLAAGWARVMARIGRGNFTDRMGADRKVVSRALGQETVPELHTVLTSLLVDGTALDEVLALYGYGLHRLPSGSGSVGDETLSEVIDLASAVSTFQRGNTQDHRAKLRLAEVARPVAQAAFGMVAEADRIRGVA
jgi:hypothetical protein